MGALSERSGAPQNGSPGGGGTFLLLPHDVSITMKAVVVAVVAAVVGCALVAAAEAAAVAGNATDFASSASGTSGVAVNAIDPRFAAAVDLRAATRVCAGYAL